LPEPDSAAALRVGAAKSRQTGTLKSRTSAQAEADYSIPAYPDAGEAATQKAEEIIVIPVRWEDRPMDAAKRQKLLQLLEALNKRSRESRKFRRPLQARARCSSRRTIRRESKSFILC